MKHFKFVLFLLVALALVLAACGSPATEPVLPVEPAESGEGAAPAAEAPAAEAPAVDPNAPVKGGTVIVGTPQEPGTLNPLLAAGTIDDVVGAFNCTGQIIDRCCDTDWVVCDTHITAARYRLRP